MLSYVTLEEAEAYFVNLLSYEKWVAFEEDLRTRALATATMQIDQLNFYGYKASASQPLEFPRVGKPLNDLQLLKYKERLQDLEIPKAVRYATCEQALYLLEQQQLEGADYANMQAQNISNYSIGDVSISFDLNRFSQANTLTNQAQNYLAPYIKRYTRLV